VDDPTKRAACVVTVRAPVAVSGVSLLDPIVVFAPGNGATAEEITKEVACTIKPSTATFKTFTFSLYSTEKASAALTSEGKIAVSGVKSGLTNLTVTTTDGGKTWTSDVIVVDKVAPYTRGLTEKATLYSKLGSGTSITRARDTQITILGTAGNWYYVYLVGEYRFISKDAGLTSMTPYEYFIFELKKLEDLVQAYKPKISSLQNYNITVNILRSLNPSYVGGNWDAIEVAPDPAMVAYINSKDPSVLKYFTEFNTLAFRPPGGVVDFLHFTATLCGQDSLVAMLSLLSGWAGDLQSMIYDLKRDTWNYPEKDKSAAAYGLIASTSGNSHFPIADMHADIDAVNVSRLYRYDRLSDRLIDYYSKQVNKRYKLFVDGSGGLNSLKKTAEEFMYPKGVIKEKYSIIKVYAASAASNPGFNLRPINGITPETVTAEESAALVYAFIKYLEVELQK
jgi:hypothetical protein